MNKMNKMNKMSKKRKKRSTEPSDPKAEKQTAQTSKNNLTRWRLVLGKYAKQNMPEALNDEQKRMEATLEQLYAREYKNRGVRQDKRLGPGSLDPSQLQVTTWLNEIRELFPKETCQTITEHALNRYGMTDLIKDPETLESLEPNEQLLGTLLSLKGQMSGKVLAQARQLIARIVEEIRRKLETEIKNAISGRLNRFQHSQMKVARNFDARDTIRRNLKNWDAEKNRLLVENPRFYSRIKRHLPWEIILCVDQSGSMTDSVIHAAIMAGILAGLPSVRLRLVVFDTSIVDLSEHASDPVEILMSVQLGGGTNIGMAVNYCQQLISQPKRTIFVLITDFCEGGDPRVLYAACKQMKEAGVKLIGLAALDQEANAWYDEQVAGVLAAEGMKIAALTPKQLAHWLADAMNQGQP